MRHVELDDLVYAGFDAYRLPAGAIPLAFGPDGPVIAAVRSRGAEHVLVGFELSRSSWPLQVSFAVFMANLVEHLTIAGAGDSGQVYQPGDSITVRAAPKANEIVITGPQEAVISASPVGRKSCRRSSGSGSTAWQAPHHRTKKSLWRS